ncbi:glycosyltransferase family 2 protein [Chroococcidiopsis sp. CCMEE 29]|uniref:glycosyltransferase family 2 protein n=1 Tax=Chroococcidiopsis sp. CCMEE 29 TaxID=155894 RepID=UPI0020228DED|nr:glycosyltransferase family 2 protein [Chroococcidiopsis sp. CCMEE 29]
MDAMHQNSLVSVIIPTYNRPLYLKEAIASAIQQKYRNIEIIISDDCSSESPQAIIEAFQDSRIRFRRNEKNLGIAMNFINAIKEARGKYIASLNDDDLWSEDFLEKLVPHLDADPDLALAFCDHYIMDSNGTINYPATEENTRRWKRNQLKEGLYQPFCEIGLVHRAVFSASAAVIRKDVIEWNNFPSEAGVFWDLYVTYLACCSGLGAYYYPGRLALYRESAESIIRSADVKAKLRRAKAGIFCYGRFMEDSKLEEFKHYFKRKWMEANKSMAVGLLQAKQVAAAIPYFWRAFSLIKI